MKLNRFNRIVYPFAYGMPGPKWGGTWCYCPSENHRKGATRRFHSEAKYRNHYRREHFSDIWPKGTFPGLTN